MELEAYIDSLIEQGLDDNEISIKIQEFKASKTTDENFQEDGAASANVASMGPTPAQEVTEFSLEDGSSESPLTSSTFADPNFVSNIVNQEQPEPTTYVEKLPEKPKPKKNLTYKGKTVDLSSTSTKDASTLVEPYRNTLESYGFEIETFGKQFLEIKSPNGESSVFDPKKVGFYDKVNNFVSENGTDEAIEIYTQNKSRRDSFKNIIKDMYNRGSDYRDLLDDETGEVEDALRSQAIESYNRVNQYKSEQGNILGFGGKTALEIDGLSDYQVDKIMNQAVDEIRYKQTEQLEEIENEQFAKYVDNQGVTLDEYYERARGKSIKLITDDNIRKSAALNSQVINKSKQLQDLSYTDPKRSLIAQELNSLKSQADVFNDMFTDKDATFFLNVDTKFVDTQSKGVEDDSSIDITSKVKSTLETLLNKKSSDFGSLEVAFGMYSKETEELSKELNSRVDIFDSKKDRIAMSGWLSSLRGLKDDYSASEFKNIKVKDLVDIYISSKGFLRKDFGEGLSGRPAGYVAGDEPDIVQSYNAAYIEELADRFLNNKAEKQAFEIAYLANIDPADVKRTGGLSTFGRTVAESFTSPQQITASYGPSSSQVLSAVEEIGVDSGIEFNTEQKKNFEQTTREFVGSSLGEAPKLALEFGVANLITGGVMGVAGLTRLGITLKAGKYFDKSGKAISYASVQRKAAAAGYRLANGKKAAITSKTVQKFVSKSDDVVKKGGGLLDRTLELGMSSVIEGLKMEAIFGDGGFETGMAFIPASRLVNVAFKSALGGQFVKGSAYHRLNELVLKPAKSGLSLVPASETASVIEAVVDDFTGGEDFKTFIEDNYTGIDFLGEGSVGRRLMGHFITGSSLGYAHVNWKNVGNTLNAAKSMRADSYKQANEITKKFGNNPKDPKISKKLDGLISSYNLANDYILAAEIGSAEVDPEISAKKAQKTFDKIAKKYYEENNKDLPLDLNIVFKGEGLDGKSAEIENGEDGRKKITIDARKYKDGLIPHEIGHFFMESEGLNNPESLKKIRQFIEPLVKENTGSDVFEAIKKEYEGKQDSETFEEEYLMALVEQLGNGGSGLVRNNTYGQVKSKLQSLFSKKSDLKLEIDTPEQLLNIIQKLASGKDIGKTYSALSGLVIKGEKIFNVSSGEAVGSTRGKRVEDQLAQLESRQNELSQVGELSSKQKQEFDQNTSQINELLSPGYGKKASIDLENKIEELEDKFYAGEIDEFDFEQQVRNLKSKKATATKPEKKKQTVDAELNQKSADTKRVLDDIGNNIEGYNSSNPEIYKLLAGMIESKSRRFRTSDNSVSNLESLPGFSMESMISETIANITSHVRRFNPKENNSLYGWITSQLSNKMKGALKTGRVAEEKFTEDSSTQKDLAGSESADAEIKFSEREASEESRAQRTIDPLRDVDVIKAQRLKDAVDVTIENVETITPEVIDTKFTGEVGEILTGIPAAKIVGTSKNFTYADIIVDAKGKEIKPGTKNPDGTVKTGVRKISDKTKALNYFDKGNNLERHIKTLPEFNVARTEAETSELGETIRTSKDVKGRAIFKSRLFRDYFYEPYVDPKSLNASTKDIAITSPSGRSKGAKSQTSVVRLKPEFRGRISTETIEAARAEMEAGTSTEFIKANIRIVSQNTANKVVRNKIEALEPKLDKSLDQVLADVKSATSSRLASIEYDKMKLFLESQGIEDGKIKSLIAVSNEETSIEKQIIENFADPKYLDRIFKEHGVKTDAVNLLRKVADKNQGKQNFSFTELKQLVKMQKKFAEFLPTEISGNRTLVKFILGRHYRFDGTGYTMFGEKDSIKKVLDSNGNEASKEEIKNEQLTTLSLNDLLDTKLEGDFYSENTKRLIEELKGSAGANKIEGLSYGRTNTIKTNLKNKPAKKQLEIIKKAAEDSKNNDARDIALNLVNSLKVDFVNSTKKGSQERIDALAYMTQLARSTSSIHYGEKALAKIVGGVTGKGDYRLEHLDTGLSTSMKGLDNIFFNKNNYIESRAILVPESFSKVLDAEMYKGTDVGILRLLTPGVRKKVNLGHVFITNKSGKKLIRFDDYVNDTKNWTLQEAQAHDAKVNEAAAKKFASIDLNKSFNEMLERKTGISANKIISDTKAQVLGAKKGKWDLLISPSAEDFVGLLYKTLGKKKQGDSDMQFYKENLLNPFARANSAIESERIALMADYNALKKQIGIVPKNLKKEIPGEGYTREQAVRAYIWTKQGMEVPGLSEGDLKSLIAEVKKSPELIKFGNQLININKGDGYAKPENNWITGSIGTDLLQGINTTKRAKHLEQWQQNADIIFSKENMNKLESIYGKQYRKAMENMLLTMKTGRNKTYGMDSLTGRFSDWINGSVGATMFFNTRSAVLQTLSATNFINFKDNNIFAAGKAFANQKQYWKDFKTLFNSDFLVSRRDGLKMSVNESDIAEMAEQGGVRGVINGLLKLGFTPTQVADSFAIASGGATFFRNRIKTYTKEVDAEGNYIYTKEQAEKKAFEDFRETADDSQQSSRPDKLSQQQKSSLGRIVLAYANTPSQYARITKKAVLDLKNGRGDAKTNISKIVYYTTLQNVLFNALQQGLFALAFDDDGSDKKEKDKSVKIANGMADSLLRGMGFFGAAISTVKNAGIKLYEEDQKSRPEYEKAALQLLNFSPPISSKYRKIAGGLKSFSYTSKEDILEKGFSLENPALSASSRIVEGATNIPINRVLTKVENINGALNQDLENWERMSMALGWQDWQIGIENEKKDKSKEKTVKRREIKRREVERRN